MVVSSRTPEGVPNRCPVCGAPSKVEPSDPPGDAPCPRCGHLLWFTCDDHGGSRVIRPTVAVIDAGLIDGLLESVTPDRRVTLTLDLSDVGYMTSAALGALVNLRKKLGGKPAGLRLRLHPDLREVFRITRLDQIFQIDG